MIECVYLTCFQWDFFFLAEVLGHCRIRLHRAETLEEADFLLTVGGGTVLLSDVTFLDGSWREALRMTCEVHPHVALLIVAEDVDRRFLRDAFAEGACGFLWKPHLIDRTISLIRAADEAAGNRAKAYQSIRSA